MVSANGKSTGTANDTPPARAAAGQAEQRPLAPSNCPMSEIWRAIARVCVFAAGAGLALLAAATILGDRSPGAVVISIIFGLGGIGLVVLSVIQKWEDLKETLAAVSEIFFLWP